MAMEQVVEAQDLKPSQHVRFYGDLYKTRAVNVRYDRVEVSFHGINNEEPYTYERDDKFIVVTPKVKQKRMVTR